jgi:hypothetical protein
MTRWLGISLIAVAILVRAAWHASWDIAIRVSPNLHRAYPVSAVVFWLLFSLGLILAAISFLIHHRCKGNTGVSAVLAMVSSTPGANWLRIRKFLP